MRHPVMKVRLGNIEAGSCDDTFLLSFVVRDSSEEVALAVVKGAAAEFTEHATAQGWRWEARSEPFGATGNHDGYLSLRGVKPEQAQAAMELLEQCAEQLRRGIYMSAPASVAAEHHR